MNILILGSSGYLGKKLKNVLSNGNNTIVSPTRKEVDLTNTSRLVEFVNDYPNFDVIYNCAIFQKTGDSLVSEKNRVFLENTLINASYINLLQTIQYSVHFITIGASCAFSKNENEVNDFYLDGTLHPSVRCFANPKRQLALSLEALSKLYGHTYNILVPGTLIGPGEQLDLSKKHFFNGTLYRAAISIKQNKPMMQFGDMDAIRQLSTIDEVVKSIVPQKKQLDKLVVLKPDLTIKVGQIYEYLNQIYPDLKFIPCNTSFLAQRSKTIGISFQEQEQEIKSNLFNNQIFEKSVKETLEYYMENINVEKP